MIESNIDFEKYADGLVPAIVQDPDTGRVLMLGFMNADSLRITRETEKVTFFSRSRSKLWTKGETSGNSLSVEEIVIDCDGDTLLIKARPAGPVCHTGADTCFNEPITRSRWSTSTASAASLATGPPCWWCRSSRRTAC